MNLNAINTLKQSHRIPAGLSDHFPSNETTMMALGIKANIITTFYFNKELEGPDQILSNETEEMKNSKLLPQ